MVANHWERETKIWSCDVSNAKRVQGQQLSGKFKEGGRVSKTTKGKNNMQMITKHSITGQTKAIVKVFSFAFVECLRCSF